MLVFLKSINLGLLSARVKQIWPFLSDCYLLLILGIVLTIPIGALDAAIAYFIKPFIDDLVIAQNSKFAQLVPIIIVLFTLVQGCFIYFSALVNTYVCSKLSLSLRLALYRKLLTFETSFFDKNTSGSIIFRFYSDVNIATSGLISNFKLFITRFFSSLSLLIVLFSISWQLSFIAISILIFIIPSLLITRKIIKRIINRSLSSSMNMLTHYNESHDGIKVIKAYGLINVFQRAYNSKISLLFNFNFSLLKNTTWLSPVLHLISAFGVAAVLYAGIYMISLNYITPGEFVSFLTALLMLYSPLKSIGGNYINIQNSFLAFDRIYLILNTKTYEDEKNTDKITLETIKRSITFCHVCFSYDSNSKEVLKDVSFSIPVGKKIALVGNSGGGKTTICSLIPRLYNVTKGSILIDGKNIKDYSLSSLRSQIAVVFQDNFLFEGTIRENIVCARENATEQEIQTAIKSACLDEFLKTLPNGIDTKIGERGVTLSGGQKQRVAIARAIIKNASLVILDEATSALDNKSEKIVQQALDNLMKGKTTIVIAHRLSTIRDADQIVVLNDGQIAEQGTHEELLEKKGVYANLYLSQFK